LVRGERLGPQRADGQERSIPEILRLVARICETVDFAHAHGVIHRDLKPANVMLGPFGEVIVLDWGIARVRAPDQAGESRSERLGTRAFMSPEQRDGPGEEVDARSDVYSIGCILQSLLRPQERKTARPLLSIIAKATATEREARYASAGALGIDLLRFVDAVPVQAHRESWFERGARLLRRHQLLVALIATYVVVRIVLFFALSR
jgi:serine/threonine-protein kinase